MSLDYFVTHVPGPALSKDEAFGSWFDGLTTSGEPPAASLTLSLSQGEPVEG